MEQKSDEGCTVMIFLGGKARGIKIPEVLIAKDVVNRRGDLLGIKMAYQHEEKGTIIIHEVVGGLTTVKLAGSWAQNAAIRLDTLGRELTGTGKQPTASLGFDTGKCCSKTMNEDASSL
jgi:hypothetical protein